MGPYQFPTTKNRHLKRVPDEHVRHSQNQRARLVGRNFIAPDFLLCHPFQQSGYCHSAGQGRLGCRYLQREMPHLLSDLHGDVLLLRVIQLLSEALDGPLGHTRHRGEYFDTKRGGHLEEKKRRQFSKATEVNKAKHSVTWGIKKDKNRGNGYQVYTSCHRERARHVQSACRLPFRQAVYRIPCHCCTGIPNCSSPLSHYTGLRM